MKKMFQKYLLIVSSSLVITTILLAPWLSRIAGKTIGYIVSNTVYWCIFCIPMIIINVKMNRPSVIRMYDKGKGNSFWNIIAFLPVIATGYLIFLPVINEGPSLVLFLSFVYAIINGTIEELFWRGLYIQYFSQIYLGYLLPSILFFLWHISLSLVKGMVYHGGTFTLLGGALFLGFLWGAVSYKTKTIRYTTISHILTNFFAFSGLIHDNWFV